MKSEDKVSDKCPWVEYFTFYSSSTEGYVSSKAQLDQLLEAFELETHTFFIVVRNRHHYGKQLEDLSYIPKVHWTGVGRSQPQFEEKTGIPYVIMGTRTLGCHHGFLKNKRKCDMVQNSEDAKISKKCGCQARVDIQHVITFPEFKHTNVVVSRHKRIAARQELLKILESNCDIVSAQQFCVKLPKLSDHGNHSLGELADSVMPMDKRLIEFVHGKVQEDTVYSTLEMKALLQDYVKNVLFCGKTLPPKANRRYWPELHQIRNHMGFSNARDKTSNSKGNSAKRLESSMEADRGQLSLPPSPVPSPRLTPSPQPSKPTASWQPPVDNPWSVPPSSLPAPLPQHMVPMDTQPEIYHTLPHNVVVHHTSLPPTLALPHGVAQNQPHHQAQNAVHNFTTSHHSNMGYTIPNITYSNYPGISSDMHNTSTPLQSNNVSNVEHVSKVSQNGMEKLAKSIVTKTRSIENLAYLCQDPEVGRNALNTLRRVELLLKKGCATAALVKTSESDTFLLQPEAYMQ